MNVGRGRHHSIPCFFKKRATDRPGAYGEEEHESQSSGDHARDCGAPPLGHRTQTGVAIHRVKEARHSCAQPQSDEQNQEVCPCS
ncbi:hypothetical protein APY03_2477 [Variovorax sp. WDL1]|nr:hypothetical protein APY03_2477 [Variovorax sp. WDL1]